MNEMILKYLPISELRKAVGDDLLDRLEELLSVLDPENYDPTEIHKRESLIKILLSFKAENLFKDQAFFENTLNSLPEAELLRIAEHTINIEPGTNFKEALKMLSKKSWKDRNFCSEFVEVAGLPDSFIPVIVEKQFTSEVCSGAEWPYKRLKDFQYSVYMSISQKLNAHLARCVVQMPTGSGKTRTAMEHIADHINSAESNGIVIWLAHSEELCDQAAICFKEVWEHIGDRKVNLFRYYGNTDRSPIETQGTSFVVTGFQKIYSLYQRDPQQLVELSKRCSLIIVDEAHKVLAPTYKIVTKALVGSKTRIMGLTATPGRSSVDLMANEELSEFFFKEIIGIPIYDETPVLQMLRNRGILSHVTRKELTGVTYELTDKQIKHIAEKYDYDEGFLRTLGADSIRNVEIIRELLKLCDDGKKVLFFGCSVEHSKFVCAVLNMYDQNAGHLDGSTAKSERKHLIDSFRDGSVQVLCNYGILSTGFDAPLTDVVFISRPTASVVLYSQMIGRGLRGPAIGGTEKCIVVDVVDNIEGMPDEIDMYNYFQDYWV